MSALRDRTKQEKAWGWAGCGIIKEKRRLREERVDSDG